MSVDSSKVSALINWLVAGAPPKRSFPDLVSEIGERLSGTGLRVYQFGLYQMLIHPEKPGRFNYWTKTSGHRQVTIAPEQIVSGDIWLGSPAETCLNSQLLVIYTLGTSPEYDTRHVSKKDIVRGDAEEIPSIILFTDLRNFTALSNENSASTVIDLLNAFYDIAELAIRKNGGEILKFMGDGLLAIFPTPDDLSAQMAAATGAVSALEETRKVLDESSQNELQIASMA